MSTPLPAKVNKEITQEQKKMVKSKIELGLPFMVLDRKKKFQMICFNRANVIEWKPTMGLGCTDMGKT